MDGESLAQQILTQLMDKYENSASFRSGKPSMQRVQLSLTDAVMQGYKSGEMDPEMRQALHVELIHLADKGLIELRWVKFEKGNILDKVYLQWDCIDQVYSYLQRISLREELNDFTVEMENWLRAVTDNEVPETWHWLHTWATEVATVVHLRGKIPSSLIPDEPKPRQLLLNSLIGLVQKDQEILPMRLFSKRYLGHSKLFERQVQPYLVRLLRKYSWRFDENFDPDAINDDSVLLREVGIETAHEDIAFCGPIRFQYDPQNSIVDTNIFPHGLAIDSADVGQIQILNLSVSRILTIENKANYRFYVRNERRQDELVIYLGGFASPGQRRFIRLLRSYAEHNCSVPPTFQHWGDLDYGGILILQHLQNTCWPEVQPWRMNSELLDKFADLVEPFESIYRDKLKRLLENEKYRWAHPLLEKILEIGGTLEQEAILL